MCLWPLCGWRTQSIVWSLTSGGCCLRKVSGKLQWPWMALTSQSPSPVPAWWRKSRLSYLMTEALRSVRFHKNIQAPVLCHVVCNSTHSCVLFIEEALWHRLAPTETVGAAQTHHLLCRWCICWGAASGGRCPHLHQREDASGQKSEHRNHCASRCFHLNFIC